MPFYVVSHNLEAQNAGLIGVKSKLYTYYLHILILNINTKTILPSVLTSKLYARKNRYRDNFPCMPCSPQIISQMTTYM